VRRREVLAELAQLVDRVEDRLPVFLALDGSRELNDCEGELGGGG
jgi:hypothetical protein